MDKEIIKIQVRVKDGPIVLDTGFRTNKAVGVQEVLEFENGRVVILTYEE